jgi:hypothetical protein
MEVFVVVFVDDIATVLAVVVAAVAAVVAADNVVYYTWVNHTLQFYCLYDIQDSLDIVWVHLVNLFLYYCLLFSYYSHIGVLL